MNKIKDTSDVDKIMESVSENAAKGLIEDNIALLEEALKRFPDDYMLLSQYAHYLTFVNWDRNGEPFRRNALKAVEIAERVLSECTDFELIQEMQSSICYYYQYAGMTDKAREAARKLPFMWSSRESILKNFLKGEELISFLQNSVFSEAMLFFYTLLALSDMGCENNPELTWEQRIKIQQKAISVYEIIFEDGDYNFCACDLMGAYQRIATMALRANNPELALESLEKAADFALYFDALPEVKPYTSLLVNKLEYRLKDVITNRKTTLCKELLGNMDWEGYDKVRQEPRFIAVEERLKTI